MKVRASFGTRDSYSTSYPLTDVNTIIKQIHNHPYNCYKGGKIDSWMAIIINHVPRYTFQDCIKLKFASEKECREFEEAIKPHVKYFTARDYSEVEL